MHWQPKRQPQKLIFLSVLLLLVVGIILGGYFWHKHTTYVQSQPTKTEQQAKQVTAYMRRKHLLGTVDLVHSNQHEVVSKGYINQSFELSNKADQPFPIYSITKLITGIMIEQLVHQGRLSMDTTLDKFYPQVPSANTITIRQLLDHNSGITMDEQAPSQLINNDNDAVQYTIQTMQVNNNHWWQYSGANFTLLAGILGKITNNTYANNFKQQIVEPLKLRHSFVWAANNNQIVQSYNYNNADYAALNNFDNNLISSELGCGDVFVSPADMVKIIQGITHSTFLSNKDYQQMINHRQSNPTQQHYAAGLYHRGKNIAYSYGSDNGFQSAIQFSEDGKNIIVVNLNQGSFDDAKKIINLID